MGFLSALSHHGSWVAGFPGEIQITPSQAPGVPAQHSEEILHDFNRPMQTTIPVHNNGLFPNTYMDVQLPYLPVNSSRDTNHLHFPTRRLYHSVSPFVNVPNNYFMGETSASNNATSAPDNGTSAPNNATSAPNSGTSAPNNATSAPNSGTSAPNNATSARSNRPSASNSRTSTPSSAFSQDVQSYVGGLIADILFLPQAAPYIHHSDIAFLSQTTPYNPNNQHESNEHPDAANYISQITESVSSGEPDLVGALRMIFEADLARLDFDGDNLNPQDFAPEDDEMPGLEDMHGLEETANDNIESSDTDTTDYDTDTTDYDSMYYQPD
jgi:hypothetical protein